MNNWRDEKYFPLIYLQLYKKQVLHFSRGYFDYTLSFSLSLSCRTNHESGKHQVTFLATIAYLTQDLLFSPSYRYQQAPIQVAG